MHQPKTYKIIDFLNDSPRKRTASFPHALHFQTCHSHTYGNYSCHGLLTRKVLNAVGTRSVLHRHMRVSNPGYGEYTIYGRYYYKQHKPAKVGIKSCRFAREYASFIHAWVYLPTVFV